MIKTVKATTLRDHLSDILKEVSTGKNYFIVTKKGRPVSALVNLDFFEDLLAATSPEYLESIKEARADYKAERTFDHEEIFGEL
ncbi:MAG: type II toxin-antitoxin system Phd/YefM family antitoxin [Candidatus Subteraquimicrobiales bacterium]|nr:type II toxin-antitoxin system Phd/YefM family antitoxin [Candidatus Subteraquimicrobiales bacterium]